MTAAPVAIALRGPRDMARLVAAVLARQLPPTAPLALIEEPDEPCHGLASVALDHPYLAALDLGAGALAAAGARFALGQRLTGFAGEGSAMTVAPSGALPTIAGLDLHQVLRRVADAAGAGARFAELFEGFRFAARAAVAGRMALPGSDPGSPAAMLGPLVTIDSEALADLAMRGVAPGRVVEMAPGARAEAAYAGAGLRIDLRRRSASDRVAAMLPGIAGLAMFKGIGGSRSGGIEAGTMPAIAASPRGIAITQSDGGHTTTRHLWFASEQGADRFAPFALAQPWKGRQLAMGASSACLGPLFSADLRLLLDQAVHLAECLPASPDLLAEARRYNRLHARSVERLVELVSAPLTLNRRAEAGWVALRDAEPPAGLRLRIAQFAARGRTAELDGDTTDRQTWIELLIGFGVIPHRYDRRADGLDPRQLDRALAVVRAQLDAALAALPGHVAFIATLRDNRQ